MDLDPRRLRFLLAVGRFGGILAAADELHMTPSAVSQQIARLERETGQVLVTRTSNGSALTAEGRFLAEAAEEIERTLLTVRMRLERGESELQGVMRIGGFQSFLSVVVAPALPGWRQRLPGVHFEVVESDREPLFRSLKAGELDAVVIELDAGESRKSLPAGMSEVPLLDEPWKLVVPAGTLVSDVADLARLPIPWLDVQPTAASAQAVARLRRAAGMDQSTVHRYVATQTALALIAAGEGMALIPMLALQGTPPDGVETLDVPGLGMRRIILCSYSRGNRATELMDAVTALVREAVLPITEPSMG
jgi:DNA-binding transcriptional LysR family regulator